MNCVGRLQMSACLKVGIGQIHGSYGDLLLHISILSLSMDYGHSLLRCSKNAPCGQYYSIYCTVPIYPLTSIASGSCPQEVFYFTPLESRFAYGLSFCFGCT